MNQSIPEWDRDGWLVFEDDYALEPKQYAQKCRERDSNREPHKLIGLEQRYPERAIGYDWVDPETKARCQDWGKFPPSVTPHSYTMKRAFILTKCYSEQAPEPIPLP